MASPTQWTWVWVNSRSWWWTGRPGLLQSMVSQNVGHDWATELNWNGLKWVNLTQMTIISTTVGSRRNRVAIIVNERVWNAVLGCNLKNDRMISVRFQGKPFNITVIQVYAPASNAEEAEVDWFSEDVQDLLELTLPKRCHVRYRGLGCQSRKSRDTWSNRQIRPWNKMKQNKD